MEKTQHKISGGSDDNDAETISTSVERKAKNGGKGECEGDVRRESGGAEFAEQREYRCCEKIGNGKALGRELLKRQTNNPSQRGTRRRRRVAYRESRVNIEGRRAGSVPASLSAATSGVNT